MPGIGTLSARASAQPPAHRKQPGVGSVNNRTGEPTALYCLNDQAGTDLERVSRSQYEVRARFCWRE